jgi:Helix-turn-helix domain
MTNKEKVVAAEKAMTFKSILDTYPGNSVKQQRTRIVAALTLWPLTTFEMMRGLDVYYPPSRIKELRNSGYTIKTLRQEVTTEAGEAHRVGLYMLGKGVGNE